MTEEESRRECPMCAGTGKVRDYSPGPSPAGASTFFVIDPEIIKDLRLNAICGT